MTKKRTGPSASSSSKSVAPSTTSSTTTATTTATVVPPTSMHYYPKKIGFLKRSWIWYEGTFAISMLEPWEKILLHSFAVTLLLLTYLGVASYLPARLDRLVERIRFYVYGSEGVEL